MSEFDKEAEREKLREKFAKDDEKRQSTKRMSELLLKGATMTNSHCNVCGDPVFRFDGQEFCPSCQDATVAGGQIQLRNPEGRQPGQQTAESAQSTQPTQAPQPTGTGPSDERAESTEAASPAAKEQGEQSSERSGVSDTTSTAARGGDIDVEPTQPPVPTTESAESDAPTQPTSTGDGADLDAARAALRRTVTRYSAEAERTDDPRRARELLAAAHEAAETLAALRR